MEPQLVPLYTRWGKALNKSCPLPEYPRPQLRRGAWQCLNGPWQYAICSEKSEIPPAKFDGEIIVPFSPESLLSGVQRQLLPGQMLWYSRSFEAQPKVGHCTLLHFGAVDQCCTVYLNGQKVGNHKGGYWPFALDVTGALRSGQNQLVVAVTDDSAQAVYAYGKQTLQRGGIWYTAQSGIWQTVWLEQPPTQHIRALKITPKYDEEEVLLKVEAAQKAGQQALVHLQVLDGEQPVAELTLEAGRETAIKLPGFKSWSPDSPFLYGLRLALGEDTVESYFAMRKIALEKGNDGTPRLCLNHKPLFHTGLLDQGYWSDGLYTPPSDEAMVWDIQQMKSMGFNMLRKHIKIEPLRWYYHCDRLGMLVWQDFVSGGYPYKPLVTQLLPFVGIHIKDSRYGLFGRKNAEGRKQFEEEMNQTVQLLYNTPSLVLWVPFNEGWGQFDSLRITRQLRQLDATRPIDHASGWHDQGGGDFKSAHIYYKKFYLKKDAKGRAPILSEFGGYSSPAPGHMASERLFGYKMYAGSGPLTRAVEQLYREQVLPAVQKGLCAAVYTQVSDVEDEINGLVTYDREEIKINTEAMEKINQELIKSYSATFL